MQIQSKQIFKLIQAPVYVAGFTYPAAVTAAITAELTAAAATAGDNGVAVPLQVATATTPGFVVTGNNLVQVFDATTGAKLEDGAGNEVYGRLTGAYDLALYSKVAGVETAYVPAAAVTIDFEVAYLFTLADLPRDAIVGTEVRYVANDPDSAAIRSERVTVTATNTLAALTQAPDTTREVALIVNGQWISSLEATADFSIAGTVVTWSAAYAGYALETSDVVIARYFI